MKKYLKLFRYTFILTVLLLFSNKNFAQSYVTLPGNFQSEVGCAGDWDPACNNTGLTYNSISGLWEGTFTIPAGNWEYKVAIDHSWNENYGLNGIYFGPNIPLFLPASSSVTFKYSHITHLVAVTVNAGTTVTLPGNFQSELGCASDWDPGCNITQLFYNSGTNKYNGTFLIPPGNYEFKVAINNSWNENYGDGGVPGGANIPLNLAMFSNVSFEYDPVTHIVTVNAVPIKVVIPGNFQSELGCVQDQLPVGGDWEPNCSLTRLTYDVNLGLFTGTFDIGAGNWEYKVALNGSWNLNYGLYGIQNGDNIPLNLKYPCRITFKYNPFTHIVDLDYVTTYLCVNKFYDPNVNGYQDYSEQNMAGITFTLNGNGMSLTQTTGSDGSACFSNLSPGTYTVKEIKPSGYYTTNGDSQVVNINAPYISNFGNVCLGSGGAKGIGFWTNKNGETALINSGQLENVLWWLRYYGLRNADGSDFDPYTYAQLKTWMLGANAKNMTYMLSAQLAAMVITTQLGYADRYNSYVYTPGCGFWGNGNFMNVDALIWYTTYWLWYKTKADGKDADRSYLECLKTGFDNANNNLTFVQKQPCGTVALQRKPSVIQDIIVTQSTAAVWPNPTRNYFSLRPASNNANGLINIRVTNINGQVLYKATGSAAEVYRFGDKFLPGLYFVEIIQGSERKTIKVAKQ